MKPLAFEEIVRNLLVYLKGQIPSLNAKTNKEEVMRQVQSISMTMRTSIVQLEGAAYNDPRKSDEYQNLNEELNSLKQTNTRLEESLFLEMNKTQELKEKLDYITQEYESKDQIIESLESEKQLLIEQQPIQNIDESQIDSLKNELTTLENQLSTSQEQINTLRQALQNKDIELSKAKDTLMEAMELDKTEIESLKAQLAEIESNEKEITALEKKIRELESQLAGAPSKEVYQNNMAAADAKISFLEKSLANSQKELSDLRQNVDPKEVQQLKAEKSESEQRITDLEAAIRRMMKSKETVSGTSNTPFQPEECVFLFEILSTTLNRLSQSPENKDLYQKAKEGIEILEKNNAINKIPTIGRKFDKTTHKAIKSFRSDFLEDNLVIYEESTGFKSGDRIIRKPLVWINKSAFSCSECNHPCRDHDFFCPKCGLELTAPDGTSKRDIPNMPTDVSKNLPLIDELIKQRSLKSASDLIAYVARVHPDNPELVKRQTLMFRNNASVAIKLEKESLNGN